MRLLGTSIWYLALRFAGKTALRLRPIGCIKGKDLTVRGFWMAASLPNRPRDFYARPIARPPDVEPAEKVMELTHATGFLGGSVSFRHPCLLPLEPGFFGLVARLT